MSCVPKECLIPAPLVIEHKLLLQQHSLEINDAELMC